MKYNRAFIIAKENHPAIRNILDNTGDEELEFWVLHSKESFHGEEDGQYFYFKDSRIETGTKLPMECIELEFSEEEITEKMSAR